MFDELYDALYAPLPDVDAYLARIGMERPKHANKATLDALVLAHLRTVPFENLDICELNAEISIGIPTLFDKIVTRRRGGYCFEQNALFMSLLQALGYDCAPIAVRVVWGAKRTMPVSHRATIVTIGDARYFCDVGFGGPAPQSAVVLEYGLEQTSGRGVFVFTREGDTTTINTKLPDGSLMSLLNFSETPCDPVDFLAPNEFQSNSKFSGFKMGRMLNLATETGSITLNGNILRINSNGQADERTLDSEPELRAAIKQYFGIEY